MNKNKIPFTPKRTMKWLFPFLTLVLLCSAQIDTESETEKEKTSFYVLIDSSASVIGNVEGKELQMFKNTIVKAIRSGLERPKNFDISYVGFSTEAQVHKTVDTIELKQKHPEFYTNWQDAFSVVPDDTDFVLLFTDSLPNTFNGDSPPSVDVWEEALKRATIEINRLVSGGTTIFTLSKDGEIDKDLMNSVFEKERNYYYKTLRSSNKLFDKMVEAVRVQVCEYHELDQCNVCFGDGSSCLGCDGEPFSGKEFDECGICGGTGLTCRLADCNFAQYPDQNLFKFEITTSKEWDDVSFSVNGRPWVDWHKKTTLDVVAENDVQSMVEKDVYYTSVDTDAIERISGWDFSKESHFEGQVVIGLFKKKPLAPKTDSEETLALPEVREEFITTQCSFSINASVTEDIAAYWHRSFCLDGDVFAILMTESKTRLRKIYTAITKEINFYTYSETPTDEQYDEETGIWQQSWEISTINGVKPPHAGKDYAIRLLWESEEDGIHSKDMIFSSNKECSASLFTEESVKAKLKTYRDPIRKKPVSEFRNGDKVYGEIELLVPNDECEKYTVNITSVRICVSDIPIKGYDPMDSQHTGCNSPSVYESFVIYQEHLKYLSYEQTLESLTGKKQTDVYGFGLGKKKFNEHISALREVTKNIETGEIPLRQCSIPFFWDAATIVTPDKYTLLEVTWTADEIVDDTETGLQSRELYMSRKKQGLTNSMFSSNCRNGEAFSRRSRQCVKYHDCDDEESYHGDCYYYGRGSTTFYWLLGILFFFFVFVIIVWFAYPRTHWGHGHATHGPVHHVPHDTFLVGSDHSSMITPSETDAFYDGAGTKRD